MKTSSNTDVPSFVSGRHLAIFDPHCKFLPGLAAENPGKRIDFVANPVADNFPDQARNLRRMSQELSQKMAQDAF